MPLSDARLFVYVYPSYLCGLPRNFNNLIKFYQTSTSPASNSPNPLVSCESRFDCYLGHLA